MYAWLLQNVPFPPFVQSDARDGKEDHQIPKFFLNQRLCLASAEGRRRRSLKGLAVSKEPTEMEYMAMQGMTSESFDLEANLRSGDERGVSSGIDTIEHIMHQRQITFDEARYEYIKFQMYMFGVDPDTGLPLDAKAVVSLSDTPHGSTYNLSVFQPFSRHEHASTAPLPRQHNKNVPIDVRDTVAEVSDQGNRKEFMLSSQSELRPVFSLSSTAELRPSHNYAESDPRVNEIWEQQKQKMIEAGIDPDTGLCLSAKAVHKLPSRRHSFTMQASGKVGLHEQLEYDGRQCNTQEQSSEKEKTMRTITLSSTSIDSVTGDKKVKVMEMSEGTGQCMNTIWRRSTVCMDKYSEDELDEEMTILMAHKQVIEAGVNPYTGEKLFTDSNFNTPYEHEHETNTHLYKLNTIETSSTTGNDSLSAKNKHSNDAVYEPRMYEDKAEKTASSSASSTDTEIQADKIWTSSETLGCSSKSWEIKPVQVEQIHNITNKRAQHSQHDEKFSQNQSTRKHKQKWTQNTNDTSSFPDDSFAVYLNDCVSVADVNVDVSTNVPCSGSISEGMELPPEGVVKSRTSLPRKSKNQNSPSQPESINIQRQQSHLDIQSKPQQQQPSIPEGEGDYADNHSLLEAQAYARHIHAHQRRHVESQAQAQAKAIDEVLTQEALQALEYHNLNAGLKLHPKRKWYARIISRKQKTKNEDVSSKIVDSANQASLQRSQCR
eukprot:CFRG6569T1